MYIERERESTCNITYMNHMSKLQEKKSVEPEPEPVYRDPLGTTKTLQSSKDMRAYHDVRNPDWPHQSCTVTFILLRVLFQWPSDLFGYRSLLILSQICLNMLYLPDRPVESPQHTCSPLLNIRSLPRPTSTKDLEMLEEAGNKIWARKPKQQLTLNEEAECNLLHKTILLLPSDWRLNQSRKNKPGALPRKWCTCNRGAPAVGKTAAAKRSTAGPAKQKSIWKGKEPRKLLLGPTSSTSFVNRQCVWRHPLSTFNIFQPDMSGADLHKYAHKRPALQKKKQSQHGFSWKETWRVQ